MPVNSFFGAALCTVDVNNDGLEDIFVGAPMYSKQSKKELEFFEEGAIFVFLGGERVIRIVFPSFSTTRICTEVDMMSSISCVLLVDDVFFFLSMCEHVLKIQALISYVCVWLILQ